MLAAMTPCAGKCRFVRGDRVGIDAGIPTLRGFCGDAGSSRTSPTPVNCCRFGQVLMPGSGRSMPSPKIMVRSRRRLSHDGRQERQRSGTDAHCAPGATAADALKAICDLVQAGELPTGQSARADVPYRLSKDAKDVTDTSIAGPCPDRPTSGSARRPAASGTCTAGRSGDPPHGTPAGPGPGRTW